MNSIEEQFKFSWDDTLDFLDNPIFTPFNPQKSTMFDFINELREKGYDEVFRAGQILFGFVLSRSREHGLRLDQAHIMFELTSDGMDIYKSNFTEAGNTETLHLKEKKFVPETEKLLNELKEYIID